MSKKMLIDASHPEETRVVVVNGTRVEELDFESQNKRQLRGNVYLARVTRVEPSLQAAFVEFGGNRHGFLAFGEIHPDYYDLPHEDRMALLEAEAQENQEDDDEEDEAPAAPKAEAKSKSRRRRRGGRNSNKKSEDETAFDAPAPQAAAAPEPEDEDEGEDPLRPAATSYGMAGRRKEVELPEQKPHIKKAVPKAAEKSEDASPEEKSEDKPKRGRRRRGKPAQAAKTPKPAEVSTEIEAEHEEDENIPDPTGAASSSWNVASKLVFSNFDVEKDPTSPAADDFKHADSLKVAEYDPSIIPEDDDEDQSADDSEELDAELLEDAADDDDAEVAAEQAKMDRKRKQRTSRRRYKIQEVVKRGQILLVQAVKEERGNKGAALTTYLSLAGRYCVLMPNTPRGGGISRKIANGSDRKRLKSIMSDLEVPKGMGVIVRTAGASRSREEIEHDYEYLARLWETIRGNTLKSFAPALIHQEGDLVKRSIRDMYNKEISEILVQGDAAYQDAHNFIEMLMPSHIDKVKKYEDDIPLFLRYQVEQQIEASLEPVAQLKSGGYLVIHPTEALVSVDVNSGRSTKERNVERTALKTNLEAAEEVARQMRLRDLAGLVVIDFIDMDENRNNRAVESKMKEALSRDRARVQMGRISQFGLMEISRQRRRRSLLEGSSASCEHCGGVGRKRSVESSALKAIRAVEEEGIRGRAKRVRLRVSPNVALYLFNEKREMLQHVDARFDMFTELVSDDTLHRPGFEIEILDEREDKRPDPLEDIRRAAKAEANRHNQQKQRQQRAQQSSDDKPAESAEDGSEGGGGKRKRRRKRGGKKHSGENTSENGATEDTVDAAQSDAPKASEGDAADGEQPRKRRRRRGRRGGRGNRNSAEGAEGENANAASNASQSQGNDQAAASSDASSSDGSDASSNETSSDAPKRSRNRNRNRRKPASERGSDEANAQTSDTSNSDAPKSDAPKAQASSSESVSKPRRSRTRTRAPAPAKTDSAPEVSTPAASASDDKPAKPKRVRAKAPAPKKKTEAASETAEKPKRVRAKAPAKKAEPKVDAKPKAEKPKRVRAKAPAPKKANPKSAAPSETKSQPAPLQSNVDDTPADNSGKKKPKGWFKTLLNKN